jgi:hypothetical protein
MRSRQPRQPDAGRRVRAVTSHARALCVRPSVAARCLDTRPMLCPALQRAQCDAQGRFLLGSPRIRSRGD